MMMKVVLFAAAFGLASQTALSEGRLPARLMPGEPNPGVTCSSSELGQIRRSVECRLINNRPFWVAAAKTAAPEMRGQASGETIPTGLAQRLRAGGLVIFWRHTQTDWTQTRIENPRQASMIDDLSLISDCGAQRNLVDYGRQQARTVGDAFARLQIKVSDVIASPFCRTRETAGLFDQAQVKIDYGLFDTFAMGGGPQTDVMRKALRSMLSEPPPAGQVRVLVGHALNLSQAGGPMPAEGEMVLFEPTGEGFRVVARMQSSQWAQLR
jgi:phosphohistidine phosphatase SixA